MPTDEHECYECDKTFPGAILVNHICRLCKAIDQATLNNEPQAQINKLRDRPQCSSCGIYGRSVVSEETSLCSPCTEKFGFDDPDAAFEGSRSAARANFVSTRTRPNHLDTAPASKSKPLSTGAVNQLREEAKENNGDHPPPLVIRLYIQTGTKTKIWDGSVLPITTRLPFGTPFRKVLEHARKDIDKDWKKKGYQERYGFDLSHYDPQITLPDTSGKMPGSRFLEHYLIDQSGPTKGEDLTFRAFFHRHARGPRRSFLSVKDGAPNTLSMPINFVINDPDAAAQGSTANPQAVKAELDGSDNESESAIIARNWDKASLSTLGSPEAAGGKKADREAPAGRLSDFASFALKSISMSGSGSRSAPTARPAPAAGLSNFGGFSSSGTANLANLLKSTTSAGFSQWVYVTYKRTVFGWGAGGGESIDDPKRYAGQKGRVRIASGAMKDTYDFRPEPYSLEQLVIKRHLRLDSCSTIPVSHEHNDKLLRLECQRSLMATQFVDLWNAKLQTLFHGDVRSAPVFQFTPSYIIVEEDESPEGGRQTWLVEPNLAVDGRTERKLLGSQHFVVGDDADAATLDACTFQHFIYDETVRQSKASGDQQVITVPADIQGFLEEPQQAPKARKSKRPRGEQVDPSVFHLNDIMLHTVGGQSGLGDGGVNIIHLFLHQHKCNDLCREMRLSTMPKRLPAYPRGPAGWWEDKVYADIVASQAANDRERAQVGSAAPGDEAQADKAGPATEAQSGGDAA